MKNPKILETKERLKLLAKLINRNKSLYRDAFSITAKKWYKIRLEKTVAEKNITAWSEYEDRAKYLKEHNYENYANLSREFRHLHIAYCELRGRTRDQIEKPREGNEPNEKLIDAYKKTILEGADENVCAPAK